MLFSPSWCLHGLPPSPSLKSVKMGMQKFHLPQGAMHFEEHALWEEVTPVCPPPALSTSTHLTRERSKREWDPSTALGLSLFQT